MKVLIIGGGPAGMIAAITAKKNYPEADVEILEKNSSLGKKLLITGKGRCNITSSLDISEFIKNIPGNGMFLYSSFQKFDNSDIIRFLENNGVKTKEERGNRVFPLSDASRDVLEAFIKEIDKLHIDVRCNTNVLEISKRKEKFIVKTSNKLLEADKIIIATGGMSYPVTGSTGDGYKFSKKFGHTIKPIRASLVPLEIIEKQDCINMQGLSLKNVAIKIEDTEKNKKIYDDFGEMLFTHFGVSGPIILSGSAHLIRYKNIEELLKNKKIKLIIDLKPAITEEQLDLRIRRDFEEFKNKEFQNSLNKILPKKMIPYIIEKSKINPEKKVNEITKQERHNLVKLLKGLEFTIKGTRPVEEAIITAGGVNIKEINPSTMQSKLVEGLYFAGEIIDVDAYTGGYNLQIAYSTGYSAGMLQ